MGDPLPPGMSIGSVIFLVVLHVVFAAVHFFIAYGRRYRKPGAHSEEDLRSLMKESYQSGLIDGTELMLVDNIFQFSDTTAREIMIPRTDMICLNAAMTLQQSKEVAITHMRTRYPVYEWDKDNVIGFIHMKDLIREHPASETDIRVLIRTVTTVPETMPISTLLKLMQRQKSALAILIDEYGGTSGLVTLEDIMEEIVGDIQDEFDPDGSRLEKREDGCYSMSGMTLIEEVNSFFGLRISSDDYDTIGGWIYSRNAFPPVPGQVVDYGEGGRTYSFMIEEVNRMRITRIGLKLSHPDGLRNPAAPNGHNEEELK
ncbi:hemolysin family protein [Paenibacillus sp. J5C2022]|uniref:hemolysin family protein n=1 Tax=Paenibacillus sp. J5C2022 TaxID=2977129 RepID=UPI00293ECFD3|nr:hemolysin family protein [Paenibacillus sp. J5C2022]